MKNTHDISNYKVVSTYMYSMLKGNCPSMIQE